MNEKKEKNEGNNGTDMKERGEERNKHDEI